MEWNVANDSSFNPHTPGGCTQCKGAITINSSENFEKNVAFYIIAHASKFVPQNATRISSTQPGNLSSLAFSTPNKIVTIILNESANTENFNVKYKGKWAVASLPAKSVATYVFDK